MAIGIILAGVAAAALGQTRIDSPRALADALIEAINTGDQARIRKFVQANVIPNTPVDQRTKRYMFLYQQGAPFKIVRELKQATNQIIVVMVDKNGSRIAMTLHYESQPKYMIQGLELAAAFTLEGAAPTLTWTDLTSLAKLILKDSKAPGIAIAMVRGGTSSIAVAGVRKSKVKGDVQPNDIWSIGSIGKPICTSVIGRLIELGKLRWDETLKQALPGVPMDPGYQNVTLTEVMMHRAGIPQDLDVGEATVKRIVGKATSPTAIRELYVRNILARKPIAPRDTQFFYSNAGYAILSRIAERAVGMPYEALVHRFVFTPLGLVHSFTRSDGLPKSRPFGHRQVEGGLEVVDTVGPAEFMFAGNGGGIFMSAGDLAKFGQAHLDGLHGKDGFLKATTVTRLHHGLPQRAGGSSLYACGWGIETLPGLEPFHGHNGANGVMRSELAIFPKAALVVVGVVNLGGMTEPAPGMQAVQAIGERYAHSE